MIQQLTHADPCSRLYGLISERVVLGTILLFPRSADELLTAVDPRDFVMHSGAWSAFQKFDTSTFVDLPLVKVKLAQATGISEQEAAIQIAEWFTEA